MKIHLLNSETATLSLEMFDLEKPHPTLILGGRTSKWTDWNEVAPRWLFFTRLAAAIGKIETSRRPVVLTGGTSCGIIETFGQVCAENSQYPEALIGVAPDYCVRAGNIRLEEHHSHILLTEGTQWEQAIPCMRMVRNVTAFHQPAIMLTMGGGEDTLKEMLAHTLDGVPLYVLMDGGRLSSGFLPASADQSYLYTPLHQQIQTIRRVHQLDLARPDEAVQELMEALGCVKGNT